MLNLLPNKKLTLVAVLLISGLIVAACNDESPPTVAATEPDVDDITADVALLTVSDENPGGQYAGEGSSKLIDGDIQTKFLTFSYNPDFWMQQDYEEEVTINAYTVTSGNDAPERDPFNWTLEGSNDGTTWETVHTVTEASFADRNKVNIYQLDSAASYSFFRFSITENAGETTLMQISEWRLLHYNEEIDLLQ